MLTIDNLTLTKEGKKIFSNLGFSVGAGTALAITGKNGVGKTSLLKIIAGISKATSGKILWCEQDIEDFRDDFNGDLQFIGHKNFLKPELTILENLRFYSRLADTEIALPAALNFFKLTEIADEKVKKLSAGWQKRVMLAKLLACPATIWLLDEPFANLDKEGKFLLKGLIKTRIKEKGLVILTTHDEDLHDLGIVINLEDFSNA
jgi:heme exporter protein A